MKTLLIATNILFLSIIIYQSCAPTKAVVNAATCPPCKSYASAFPGLTTTTARMISVNYKTHKSALAGFFNHGTVPDANSIWFSLESLKVLSGTLKMLPARMVCNSNQLKLGVRIYYARYPDDVSMNSNPVCKFCFLTALQMLSPTVLQNIIQIYGANIQDAGNPNTQWDFDPWHWSASTSATNGCIMPTSMAQWFVDTIAPF